MEKHICKLCSRSFVNGRALGGHMRSHAVATRPAAASMKSLLAADCSSSSTSSREAEEGKGLCYGLRENPRKSFRMVDPEFSFAMAAASSSVVQDRESETESSPQATAAAFSYKRRRSERPRRSAELLEAELLNSFSDNTSPEVDLAITFMLLSRDVWNRFEEEEEAEEYEAGEEETEPELIAAIKPQPSPAKGRSRFQCGTCHKIFRSYQALGGHRASHKKSRSCLPPVNESGIKEIVSPETNADCKSSVHICPICFREFACGQALGGHKRSHHLSSSTTTTTNINLASPPPPAKLRQSLFDLNLPAPLDDDAELSAVSEAEFVNSLPRPLH
ncbi:Zinc finger protein ZAT9 [Platanthera zijinensis]|uniref:Zinc finger protein ZAT9 n=1 Tax=Platanthera zijinensis TaxID=2320716 RepID=A0AAP0G8D4_9ASPA